MIQYIENSKETIRRLLELINKFSKVAGYKVKTQKSLPLLYTNNAKSERQIKESISFTIATKRIKYLGINLPKETKELYTENYFKTLMKEIKNDRNRWRDIPCSWVGRLNYCENCYSTKHNLQIQCKSESEVTRVQLFATPWTTAYQAPLSMGFSRQEE